MENFDFDRLRQFDPVAFEQTVAFFDANPELPLDDMGNVSFGVMLDDAAAGNDWMETDDWESRQHTTSSRILDVAWPATGFGSYIANDDHSAEPHDYRHRHPHGQVPIMSLLESENPIVDDPSNTRSLALDCTWEDCSHVGVTAAELVVHLNGHAQEARDHFEPSSQCFWKGCNSKVLFKTKGLYNTHLKNIHINPLLCTVPRCVHKKPFRNQADLDRHRATAHSERRDFVCPYETCEAEVKTFARKDKWLKHIQETQHLNDAFCPFHHCRLQQSIDSVTFTSRKEITKHFSKYHAGKIEESFECDLGTCGWASSRDQWNKEELEEHLQKCHAIKYEDSFWTMREFPDTERILKKEHLKPYGKYIDGKYIHDYTPEWKDCTLCTQAHQHPQAPSNEQVEL